MMDVAQDVLRSVGLEWFNLKTFLTHSTSFSRDALHVIAGVLLQIAAATVLRTSLSNIAPWLIAFAAELVNECVDLWLEPWPDRVMQFGEGAKDMLLTMFLPTVLLLVSRYFPEVLRRSP